MEEVRINIATDFRTKLGGRWKSLGPNSGEEFYDLILKDKFEEAIDKKLKLHVFLDGTKGYGSSFLDQSFGELGRKYGTDLVLKTIQFHTDYFEWIVEYIVTEIWER